MSNLYLVHHGILGQKWGVRRFQNKDGSLTSAGKKRYNSQLKNDIDKQAKQHKSPLYGQGIKTSDEQFKSAADRLRSDFKALNDKDAELVDTFFDEAESVMKSKSFRDAVYEQTAKEYKKYADKDLDKKGFYEEFIWESLTDQMEQTKWYPKTQKVSKEYLEAYRNCNSKVKEETEKLVKDFGDQVIPKNHSMTYKDTVSSMLSREAGNKPWLLSDADDYDFSWSVSNMAGRIDPDIENYMSYEQFKKKYL